MIMIAQSVAKDRNYFPPLRFAFRTGPQVNNAPHAILLRAHRERPKSGRTADERRCVFDLIGSYGMPASFEMMRRVRRSKYWWCSGPGWDGTTSKSSSRSPTWSRTICPPRS